MSASEVIALRAPEASRAFEPASIDEAYRLAKLLVASRMLADGITGPEAAFAIIATGRELGLTAMQSLRSIHVIKGRPTLSADLVCALVKSRTDVCEYFRLVESTELSAVYETKRRGEPEPTTMRFTLEDAKRAQLLGSANWQKFPAAMLRARCITSLARAVYPDLVMGIYDPDEIADRPTEPAPLPIKQAQAVTVPGSGPTVFDKLVARLDSADSAMAINSVAVEAKRMHAGGLIDESKLQQLAAVAKTKRAILEAKVPDSSEAAQ